MAILTPDMTLLGLLAAEPQHGYQLLERFNDPAQLGRVWKLSTSQLYNVLKRLERDGLIVGHETSSDSGPSRIEYMLTTAGQQRLEAWLYDPAPSPSIRRVRVEFASRLFIARALGWPSSPIIECQQAACQREYDRLRAQHASAAPGMDALMQEFMLEQLAVALRWIARCADLD